MKIEELQKDFYSNCECCGNDKPEYTQGFYGANFCNNCYDNGYSNVLCIVCKYAFWTNLDNEKKEQAHEACLVEVYPDKYN